MELPGDVVIQGTLRVKGGILGDIPREKLATDSLKAFNIPLTDLRVWDAFGTMLPTAGSNDDLGLTQATFASALPYIGSGNLNAAGATTRYARFSVQMPHNYVPGGTAKLRAHTGMYSVAADVAASIDFQAYISSRDVSSAITGSDVVSTGSTLIFSGAFVNTDFTLTATRLAPGTWLDCRLSLTVDDAVATGDIVEVMVTNLELICDVQG